MAYAEIRSSFTLAVATSDRFGRRAEGVASPAAWVGSVACVSGVGALDPARVCSCFALCTLEQFLHSSDETTAAPPLALNTQHDANIFGVHFLPCTGDRAVVSGSMDRTINLHRLDATCSVGGAARRIPHDQGGRSRGEQMGPPVTDVHPRTTVYACHKGRVKVGGG